MIISTGIDQNVSQGNKDNRLSQNVSNEQGGSKRANIRAVQRNNLKAEAASFN
jgi:hypothetical protein